VYQINFSKRGLRSTLLLGAASAAAIGLTAPASAQSSGTVETVVVTGSRIPQQGLYSSSPVTAVGQQEMKFEGTTDVATLINNLPAAFADQTSTASNGATGTANVDLRGLGSSRTLVLVNGTRLMPGDPIVPVADLNQIPAALVDHVEVLTGGASAVYGSDAEAGVVNFIMRKDFEGVEFDGQYSVDEAGNNGSSHGVSYQQLQQTAGFPSAQKGWTGGSTDTGTLIIGANTDNGKGNVTAYLDYRDTQAVLEGSRDFSACSLTTNFSTNLHCSGSSNYNRFRSFDNLVGGGGPFDNFELGNGTAGSGTFIPYTGTPAQHFNYGALNYLQRPDTRYSGGFFAHYEVNKQLDVYSNFMFSDDHTLAQIAPSGLFIGSGPANFPGTISPGYNVVNCSNPLMTAQEQTTLCNSNAQLNFLGNPCTPIANTGNCNLTPGDALLQIGRRDLEGGNRIDNLRHTAYRMVIGAKGDLGDGWSYDIYGQYGISLFTEEYENEFSKQRVENDLDVVNTASGPQCEVKILGIDNSCVPLDIFNGFGAISPAALKYVTANGFKEGFTQEQVVSGSINGDLGAWGIQSPWAKSPVAVAVGAEYRQEGLELQTSRDFQINDLYGQGGATLPVPLSSFNVEEGFTEVQVPLIQDMPFAEDVSLNGGYRYSSYSISGSVQSYKYGVEWQPIDDFRLRGSVQRAVRAPNVLELFSPQNTVLFVGQDPCATSTAGQCAFVPNAGTSALGCPSAQCNHQLSGNIHLKPEVSDTKSFGVVLTPTFIDGFTATIDYFDIKVDNYISIIGPQVILNGCYAPNANTAAVAFYCPFVHRNSQGAIFGSGYVLNKSLNLPFLSTKGIDFEANYNTSFDDWDMTKGWGALSFNFVGTMLDNLVTKSSPVNSGGNTTYDCAGLYGVTCGTPSPDWRHKLRVTWSSPWDFDVSVDWRHLSGVNLDANTANTQLGGTNVVTCPNGSTVHGAGDCPDNSIGSFDYFDVAANWTVREGVSLRFGVDNVFDKDPPTVDSNSIGASAPPFGNGNTFPGVYDSLGRTFFIGGTIKY